MQQLAGVGGMVFASRLAGCGSNSSFLPSDFFFMQLSDTHIGYSGAANPNPTTTLPMAIAAINAMPVQPDFIIFTGDLTHVTDSITTRQMRMAQFQQMVSQLKVQTIHYMPGEHDAGPDGGMVYQQMFGTMYYSFDYKGVHFIALDNVSNPMLNLGTTQLNWLKSDLAAQSKDQPIVVFSHIPLFMLYPPWGWETPDGETAINMLMEYTNVTVFYGHIHQENTFMTGNIVHRSTHSLMFPLPPPPATETPFPMPVAWNSQMPYAGLGYREVQSNASGSGYLVTDVPLSGG
jgi:3',5'-cyclic AMP phosphodiesterase CpdA